MAPPLDVSTIANVASVLKLASYAANSGFDHWPLLFASYLDKWSEVRLTNFRTTSSQKQGFDVALTSYLLNLHSQLLAPSLLPIMLVKSSSGTPPSVLLPPQSEVSVPAAQAVGSSHAPLLAVAHVSSPALAPQQSVTSVPAGQELGLLQTPFFAKLHESSPLQVRPPQSVSSVPAAQVDGSSHTALLAVAHVLSLLLRIELRMKVSA